MADFPRNQRKQTDYQIDDILEEARRIKQERMQQPVSLKPIGIDSASSLADSAAASEKRDRPSVLDAETRSFPVVQMADQPEEDEEPVKIYVPVQTAAPAEKPDAQPIHTEATQADSDADELEQIRLDSLLEDVEDEPPVEETDDWEERLRIERRQKAENFKLNSPVALRLSGEEEENDPGEEPDEFVEEEIDDFSSYEDTEAVRSELVYQRRTGWIQVILSGVFACSLVGAAVLYWLQWSSINPLLYVSVNIFLLSLAALINHRVIGEGMKSLIRMQANADSMTAVLLAVSMLHTLLQFLNPEVISGDMALVLAPVAAVGLFFSSLGRQMLVLRVVSNFQFVSHPGDKYAARIVEDRKTAAEIGRAAVAIGDPVVCYIQKTDFLTRFLENSYLVDGENRTMRVFVPCALGVSAVVGLLFGIAGTSVMGGLASFATTLCLAAPLSAMTAFHYPLLRAARRALRHGAMLVGWQAAEDFGDVHALAVDALELFPSESVLLHGIKTFSGTRIDEAILDAAAVSIAAGGPLSSVFRRVIQNRTDILKEVDTLVYEQDMGMSGWVGGRRVLIGNRRLLENHGVDVPSRDYENRMPSTAGRSYTCPRRASCPLCSSSAMSRRKASPMRFMPYAPQKSRCWCVPATPT